MSDFALWLMRDEAPIAEGPGKWNIGDIVQVKQVSPAPGTLDAGARHLMVRK